MKKVFFLSLAVALIIITALGLFLQKISSEMRQREGLARELGLDPEIYSRDLSFPENYFYNVLVPGMPINQVHQLVKGYKAVYACEDSHELYYFYSVSEKEAHRFAVLYESDKDLKQKKVVTVLVEDTNSGVLALGVCTPGQLKPGE